MVKYFAILIIGISWKKCNEYMSFYPSFTQKYCTQAASNMIKYRFKD